MCFLGCGKLMDRQSVHLLEDVLTIWIKVCVSHLGEGRRASLLNFLGDLMLLVFGVISQQKTVVWRSKGNLQFHLYNMSVGFWMLKWSTPSSTMEVWNGSLSENPFLYKQTDHFSTPRKWGVKLKKKMGGAFLRAKSRCENWLELEAGPTKHPSTSLRKTRPFRWWKIPQGLIGKLNIYSFIYWRTFKGSISCMVDQRGISETLGTHHLPLRQHQKKEKQTCFFQKIM